MRAITACIQNNTRTTLNKQQFEVAGNSRDDNKVAGCADAPAARTRLGRRPPRGTQAARSQPYSVAPSVYHYRGMPPLILHSISFTLLSTFRHIHISILTRRLHSVERVISHNLHSLSQTPKSIPSRANKYLNINDIYHDTLLFTYGISMVLYL